MIFRFYGAELCQTARNAAAPRGFIARRAINEIVSPPPAREVHI
jgi:hypothetical protein